MRRIQCLGRHGKWLSLLILLTGTFLLMAPAVLPAPADQEVHWHNGRYWESGRISRERSAGGRAIVVVGRHKLALTGQIVVHLVPMSSSDAAKWGAAHRLTLVGPLPGDGGTWLYDVGDGLKSLETANKLVANGEVLHAYPNFERRSVLRFTPNDPDYNLQWHLLDTGNSAQGAILPGNDINVSSVWNTFRGDGTVIQVVDSSVQIGHQDLAANVLNNLCFNYNNNSSDPSPTSSSDDHGTSCAGIASARGNNSLGVTGVAFDAGLVGVSLIGGAADTDANEAAAMVLNDTSIVVSSNSWGPSDSTGPDLEAPPQTFLDAERQAVQTGRNGLGVIFCWAGGNGDNAIAGRQNSNEDGWANSRFVIAVGASNSNGVKASYSEQGANLLVNAPSGDLGLADIVTTDNTGVGDLNANYTALFNGTSASAPMVAGACALIVQANPALSWRDVIAILAQTSTKIDPTDAGWITNGAGLHFNHKYGFGRLNVASAVNLAKTFTPLGTETTAVASAFPQAAIPDNNAAGVSSTVSVAVVGIVETVQVTLNAPHARWSDLTVTLTSPSGSVSVLSPTVNATPATAGFNNWTFTSRVHMGEPSNGNWTIKVADLVPSNTGTFQSWTLSVFGTNLGTATAPTPTPTPTPTPAPTPAPVSSGNSSPAEAVRSGGGGGCFIATAAYGSYLEPHVMVLRTFRDRRLLTNAWGRSFVHAYYAVSPPVAAFIGQNEMIRFGVRTALTPLVWAIESADRKDGKAETVH